MPFPGLNRTQVNNLITIALGVYYTSSEVDNLLSGKSDVGHTHDYSGVYAALNHNHAGVYSPVGHTHDYSAVYAALVHDHDDRYYTDSEVDAAFAALSGVYAPASHNHSASAITSGTLDSARLPDLSGVYALVGHNHDAVYAALSHTHDDRYYTESEITTLLSGKADSSHTHAATDITSGTLDNARVNWGSPSAIGGTAAAEGTFTALTATALTINGASGAGFAQLANQASAPGTPTSALRVYADGSNRLAWKHASGFAAVLDTSGFTADRVLTFPNATGTLVTQAATQTLTNKTLTSPIISGGAIDNAVVGGTTAVAGTFTVLTSKHPSPTGTAGGITIKGYNPNEGGFASMELAGTNTAVWTAGKGLIVDNYAANFRFGSTVQTPVIAANIAWLGSSAYQTSDPALTVVGNSGKIDIQALLYASSPYPDLHISAPMLVFKTKAGAGWADGGTGFTGYGTERLRLNDAGLRVEAASAINFGDETADNAWRIVRSGNDLVIQRRVAGSWVTKQTISA